MIKILIIMISLLVPALSFAQDCGRAERLVVTSPKNGAKTLYPSVTVRGFLCQNAPLILIRNITTNAELLTETTRVCDREECAYHFAVSVRGLEPGQNRITAEIPGEDIIVEIDVVRTALAEM